MSSTQAMVAAAPVNYYFALGVTPMASTERIHRAYRLRAREVHPDFHQQELNRELWGQLMAIAAEAHRVLTDDAARRAYDQAWRRESRRVTAGSATSRERRGDWRTRYHWYMAEIAEIEDNIEEMMADIRGLLDHGRVVDEPLMALLSAADLYEQRILEVRTAALAVPAPHKALADRARLELVRKDRLVSGLLALGADLPRGLYRVPERTAALELLARTEATRQEVRDAHRRFEVEILRQAAA